MRWKRWFDDARRDTLIVNFGPSDDMSLASAGGVTGAPHMWVMTVETPTLTPPAEAKAPVATQMWEDVPADVQQSLAEDMFDKAIRVLVELYVTREVDA
jgi:hypothetical protein